ncbi:M48 family metallopeptidase [Hymenobacter jejuensis]|uniref:M48 family metallopeptidase n=1 Tax=Hymenobacter jejuensis TaxID=2502781 RepID=A0A5B8A2N4_9BACT|nr:SprT family zinc-dependent metalloprotease [Hymenobacter jejuensis]QDA61664.1 M48 family metallopeptidase [Hymenobacter jejuensis]
MPSVQYGETTIHYTVQDSPQLKAHYLSVEQHEGVVLKGRRLPGPQADRLVLQKARWVLEKLDLVRTAVSEDLVTGARIGYLGRRYYAEVVAEAGRPTPHIDFNHSRFRLYADPAAHDQATMHGALDQFFRAKAEEKLPPRVQLWAARTGLAYREVKVRTMAKRWGSCTPTNTILLNPDVIKLPYSLIDYVIVHELCHTKVKDHSKEFWAELARHLPNWKELDARVNRFRL